MAPASPAPPAIRWCSPGGPASFPGCAPGRTACSAGRAAAAARRRCAACPTAPPARRSRPWSACSPGSPAKAARCPTSTSTPTGRTACGAASSIFFESACDADANRQRAVQPDLLGRQAAMTLNLTVMQQAHTDFTPRITVIGVGGGGTNAVDNMIAANLQGVEFVVANTDAQQLMHSRADRRIQLGPHITQGLGAGAKPEIGRAAAEEAADELYRHLDGAHMAFITAGMGGGTGTGAAPVIARMARERNILTVGVVTKPFTFEGSRRARAAEEGILELTQYVDTLIVIPNQNLFRLANERTGWKEAFKMADNVLYMGVRGVTDLMVAPGLVNLDFADIRTVMAEMGKAMMGTGEADGENRAIRAAEAVISNPLLEDTCMAGARGLLINITGGEDMTLFEVDQAANRIREEVDEDANIIFGSAIDENLAGKIRVSVVATGIESPEQKNAERARVGAVGGTAVAQAVAS